MRKLRHGKKATVEELSAAAKKNLEALATLARESVDGAATELYRTTALATFWLTWLCEKKPDLFIKIAREQLSWPVMYDPHPEGVRGNAKFIKNLKLGTNTQINLSSGKTFSWRVPANIVAVRLHRLAQSLRRPPMRSWTTRDWILVAQCGVGCSQTRTSTTRDTINS